VALFLIRTLSEFIERKRLGKVFHEPFQMKTGPKLPSRAPDVLYLSNASLVRQKRVHVEGPADLVVEVISPGSRSIDRGAKFYEYEEGGVPEYWLIDPERKQVELYQLGADKIYRQAAADGGEIYRSKVLPGFWLKVDWLWDRPTLTEVVEAWKL
jgi:Uma2 family endonuclease